MVMDRENGAIGRLRLKSQASKNQACWKQAEDQPVFEPGKSRPGKE